MGRLNINTEVAVEAEDDFLDKLEDIDTPIVISIDTDMQAGDVHSHILANSQSFKSARRRLEDRLEDIKLQRQITDYSINLH